MNPKVLIVEDKMIVAQDICDILESKGCLVTGIVASGESAIEKFSESHPDIVLMDIRLKGKLNGIETVKRLRELGNPAIIYLTAQSNPSTLQSAFDTQPENYLVKPFSKKDLEIAIGLTIAGIEKHKVEKDSIVFRHKGIVERVLFQEILFAKANGSYTTIFTCKEKYTGTFNLNHFETKVNDRFVRTHRSYVVNLDRVERYTSHVIFIGNFEIPVSRANKQKFLSRFRS